MSPQSKTFFRYIHNFRGLAILLIVLGHTAIFLDLKNDPILWHTNKVITDNSSVYFVFIAGFLFQFLSAGYQYGSYLKKKFVNVILPYLVVSIPALGFCLIKDKPFYIEHWFMDSFNNGSVLQKTAILLLTGSHFYHFWFIPMIAVFYISAPVFIAIDKNPKFYYFLPILIFLSILVPRPDDDALILQNFVHFTSVYVLGMFCCHYRENVMKFMQKHCFQVVLAAIALIALQVALRVTDTPFQYIFYFNTTSKSILSLVFMYLLRKYDSSFPSRTHRMMGLLADFSFGIYFLHAYIIFLYLKFLEILQLPSSMNLFSMLLLLSTIMVLTLGVLLISKHFLGKRTQYLVGC